MDFFGGLMKGFKPLMDAAGVKEDDSMQITILQSEVMELEGKKHDALEELGQAAYEMVKSNNLCTDQLLALCEVVDVAEGQLQNKKSELDIATQTYEKKLKEEEEKLAARTCPNCNEVNDEGTRFCQCCGTKLGFVKQKENICKACGAANNPSSSFCGECGARLQTDEPTEITCPSCGEVLPAGTRFCGECGTKLQ